MLFYSYCTISERFLYDFFNFGTFYRIQRVLVFCLFVMCTIYLTKVSSRYREDMSFKNIFVTSTVAKLDKQVGLQLYHFSKDRS